MTLTLGTAWEAACRTDLSVFAEHKLGFENAPHHVEWCDLVATYPRLALVAPREHAKTQVCSVNQTVWRCFYTPGFWAFLFTSTGLLAHELKERIDSAMHAVDPAMVDQAQSRTMGSTVFANGSRVDTAGSGKAVRGLHPDLIVGDDVLEEENTLTLLQRKRMERWWFGTVGPMAHPLTERTFERHGERVTALFPPTTIHLVGTPFAQGDLLLGMKHHPIYRFRRYAAEFDESDLVPGSLAVEAS